MRTMPIQIDKLRCAMVAIVTVALGTAGLGARSAQAAEFGIRAFDQQVTANAAGAPFFQAGAHPYEITTELELNAEPDPGSGELNGLPRPAQDAKDIVTELPPGLFGNPAAIPQCTDAQLLGESVGIVYQPTCPVSSQVGVIEVRNELSTYPSTSFFSFILPVFNMVPSVGEPAKFGFNVGGVPITLTGNVRNGGDFGVTVISKDIPTALSMYGITLTFWGVPADPSHDAQRCPATEFLGFGFFNPEKTCVVGGGPRFEPHADPEPPVAFLTMPVSCEPPGVGFQTTVYADPWANPGAWATQSIFSHLEPGYPLPVEQWGVQQGMTGCDKVPFDPAISVQPTNNEADTPTGLNIEISLPQDGLSNPNGIATSDVKKAVVALPAGVSVSPSAADGLSACSLEQIGLHTSRPAGCPDSAKLGTVEIDTPLLRAPLKGSIFLARQSENPFGSLLALYIVAEANGVIIKLSGRVDLDPTTGRITTTFDENPQLPFDHLKINFKAGPRSPIVNPHECGTYDTTSEFSSWSGGRPVTSESAFQIASGPNGGPCPSPRQFTPGLSVGTTSNQAGGYSPLSLTMTRNDGDEQLGLLAMKTPSGLLGNLSGVTLCSEPQASQGTCGPESQIGSVVAAAGAGANPFYVTGGRVYLTGPYEGAPFGLSVVVPAKAGPLDLGIVIVRGTIAVDPHTAGLTITTDPLPTILQGIPLDLRLVNVSIDRPAFLFNPTNCDPHAITGTLTGGLGDVEPFTTHFQVTNCAALNFKPKFQVWTNGKTSRAKGASLKVKLSYPRAPFGSQDNLARVKVELPKRLPSRLETLQKACSAGVFEANPAACPAASKIGTASATTPILPVALSGPMYFVSHGGEAWPDLVIVLQGYNVTVQLVGTTFINERTGITSTTFKTIPDVPVGSFQLELPRGRYSALAANGNLCRGSLRMPTEFVSQSGIRLTQQTHIAATGCTRHKARRRRRG